MASKRIAVAGGIGGIGQHVVEGLLELASTSPSLNLHIIVLSRSSHPPITFASVSAPVIQVDYTSPSSISSILNEHSIDTIISALAGTNPEAFITAQKNLLQAALSIPTFRRFAPSEFAVDSERVGETIKLYSLKLPILDELRKVRDERCSSKFEFTKFNCGIFMNYYGFGNTKPDGGKAFGHLKRFSYIVDLSTGKADIPGRDLDRKIRVTRAEDVGKFIAAATQLDKWEEDSDMMGDEVTFRELVKMAEEIAGIKIDVKYNSAEDLRAKMDPNPTSAFTNFHHEVYLAFAEGKMDLASPPRLNELTDVKPMKVEEFLRIWWGN